LKVNKNVHVVDQTMSQITLDDVKAADGQNIQMYWLHISRS